MKILKPLCLAAMGTLISANALAASNAFENFFVRASEMMRCYTLDCAHWYVGGNIGVSHLFDNPQPGIPSSVDQNGPGWNVNFGYQINSLLGAELGYTQYYHSRESLTLPVLGSVQLASTTHFATYLAMTGRWPLFCKFSALGKLGAAYSYANKVFNLGPSGAAGAVSLTYGLGLDYSVTQKVDFIFQWNRVRGNNFTGSSDLWSLGATFAIV